MSTPGLSEKASQAQPADEKAVPAHLRCNCCNKPVFNAFQTPHGCRICQTCFQTLLHPTERRLCPGTTEACKDEEEEIHISQATCVPEIATRQEISKLTVLCPNRDGGCKEQMKLREVDAHLEKCEYEKVTCEQCRDSILKRRLRSHLSDECRQRRAPSGSVQQSSARSPAPRIVDLTHMMKYFKEYGKKMKELEKTSLLSRRLSVVDTLLINEMLDLQNSSHDGSLFVWKVENFSQRRREAVSIRGHNLFSQPFFNRSCGLKFRVRLFLNGNESGEGTHVSVYLVLMQHELDDIKEWPLKASVSFKIINLKNRADYVAKSVRFDSGNRRLSRCRNDLSVRCGKAKFIKINKLENSDRFVKNDSFYLEVEVFVDKD